MHNPKHSAACIRCLTPLVHKQLSALAVLPAVYGMWRSGLRRNEQKFVIMVVKAAGRSVVLIAVTAGAAGDGEMQQLKLWLASL